MLYIVIQTRIHSQTPATLSTYSCISSYFCSILFLISKFSSTKTLFSLSASFISKYFCSKILINWNESDFFQSVLMCFWVKYLSSNKYSLSNFTFPNDNRFSTLILQSINKKDLNETFGLKQNISSGFLLKSTNSNCNSILLNLQSGQMYIKALNY